ncbi:MAG: AAA family ATPase [Clostridia bacterium]|nr:AAA family ATPase [Clostridia bacterium]
MDKFDENIIKVDRTICTNISKREILNDDGLLAQNVVAQLRNFVEAIILKVYSINYEAEFSHDCTKKAISFIKGRDEYSFLRKFHNYLEVSDSHLTAEPDACIRLLWRYYDFLTECKKFLKKEFNLDVLSNIEDLPLDEDETLKEYYQKISVRIQEKQIVSINESPTHRFYIIKKKIFRVDGEKYYEYTLLEADNKASKFDRIIAFSKLNIPTYYAVHLRTTQSNINIIEHSMMIQIIVGFKVSIRPCEFNNFFKILGYTTKVSTYDVEYSKLMLYLTKTGRNLIDFLELDDEDFDVITRTVWNGANSTPILNGIKTCRALDGLPGYNTIKYLLFRLNNKVIREQLALHQNEKLSNLFLKYGCIPFDKMPFASNLLGHSSNLFELYECFGAYGREHELLGRIIKNKTELEAKLYSKEKELPSFSKKEDLIKRYNSTLYYKHQIDGSIVKDNNFYYISGYENDAKYIIEELIELTKSGLDGYRNSVKYWLKTSSYKIDDEIKENALKNMFISSRVALIFGSAGTGKSTMIKHISMFFADKRKLYLTNTHSALENLKRNIGESNFAQYSTIKSFIDKDYVECDILFIDECSTVSNYDMASILAKARYKLLVLVGDVFQIESIKFGNWFNIAYSYIPKSATSELTYTYRSADNELKKLWKMVRDLDPRMYDFMEINHYCSSMDKTIFDNLSKDEIVLCLNYDGLYGINNINKFLQDNNQGKMIQLGVERYKVGDPIIFNGTNRFAPFIYNNLKGEIVDIIEEDRKVKFVIEVNKVFNELDAEQAAFDLEEQREQGKSVISFYVGKFNNKDDDDKEDFNVVPFQVAYATSIHKAQGLEYDSVKIVITDGIEEMISHNVFYTAITRAKNKLHIYWTKKAEQYVLDNMHYMYNKEDAIILANKYKLKRVR